MPKTLEAKLRISSEVRDEGLKGITKDLADIATGLSKIRDIGWPGAPGARGGGPQAAPVATGKPSHGGGGVSRRSENAPPLRAHGFAGGVARGVMGAGGLAAAVAAGEPLPAIGGMLREAGGGIMGAFGGMGAVAGIGLLTAGVGLGLMHAISAPRKAYMKATGGLGARLGRGWLDTMSAMGTNYGIDPTQMAGYIGQLEGVGATKAAGAMGQMRLAGVMPEMTMPWYQAVTRAGGAGGRGTAEYETMTKMLGAAVKDVHSIPGFLQGLVSLTEQVESHTADIREIGNTEVMALMKWGEASGSMGLKGTKGAGVFGAVLSGMAAPGGPGKEMLIWSTLAQNTQFRQRLVTAGVPGITGAKGPASWWQMQIMRNSPLAIAPMIQMLGGMPGEWGPMMLQKMANINPETAQELIDLSRKPGANIETIREGLEKAKKEGKLPGIAKDPALSLDIIAAKTSLLAQNLVDNKFLEKTMQTEENMLIALQTITNTGFADKMAGAAESISGAIANLLSGNSSVFKASKDAITEALSSVLPRWFGPGKDVGATYGTSHSSLILGLLDPKVRASEGFPGFTQQEALNASIKMEDERRHLDRWKNQSKLR